LNAPALLNSRAVMIAAGVAVGAVALYLVGRKVAGGVGSAIANVNRGTPYEGTGPVGTVGHAADVVSGGLLSSFGGWLGRTIFDLTNRPYDPNK
jgi:hypothetical protein